MVRVFSFGHGDVLPPKRYTNEMFIVAAEAAADVCRVARSI